VGSPRHRRHPALTRREFVAASAGLAASLLDPLRKLEAAVKPVRITDVDVFRIEIPTPEEHVKQGRMNRYTVCRIDTDAGVRGYSFAGPDPKILDSEIRPALVGADLFAIERHLEKGAGHWNGLEHAIWDAIGKIANRPVYELLGGGTPKIKVYLTTVWFGNQDQSHVAYDEQAAMAVKFKEAGFKGMKIRAWRPNSLDDTEACRVIREAVGPDFAIMFDRTAHAPESVGQKIWDYDTALEVARAFEKNGAYWLEEPFARDDFVQPAKLAREVDMPITGGEGLFGLEPFREALVNHAYDIVQPENRRSGGIWICRKVAALAEAFHVPCVLHGTMGLMLAGALQISASINAEWQEFVFIRPPLMPEEVWSPGLEVLNREQMYRLEDGHIHVPDLPGIGLDVNEEAVERFRQA
jgi:D-galactarolactone cycloisomerase